MKKALAILLAFVLVLGLAACGNSQPTTAGKNDPTNKPATPSTVPTPPSAPSTNGDAENVVVDNDNFTLKFVSTSTDETSYILSVSVVNKTDSTLSFTLNNVSANDYVCPDIYTFIDVEGKQETDWEIFIDRAVLDRNGVADPAKIEFTLEAADSVMWETIYKDICVIYPHGENSYVDDGGYSAKEGDTVLVDNDSFTVIITGYEPENENGYTMNMYIMNKTAQNLTFALENVTVNGLMLENYWSSDVAAGKRAHCSATWYGTEMSDYNLGEVTMIGFDLTAKDPNDGEAVDHAGISATVYPMGEAAAKPFERVEQETDIVLMSNEYVTITATSIGMDADGNYVAVLFLENHSDVKVYIIPTGVCLNGVELDLRWGATVSAGKATFGSITWFGDDLTFNGITTVETITMTITVYDENAEESFIAEDITITL